MTITKTMNFKEELKMKYTLEQAKEMLMFVEAMRDELWSAINDMGRKGKDEHGFEIEPKEGTYEYERMKKGKYIFKMVVNSFVGEFNDLIYKFESEDKTW